jgi:hypothetical protein
LNNRTLWNPNRNRNVQGLVDKADVGGWAVGFEKRRRQRSSMVRYPWASPTGAKLRLRASSLAVGIGNPAPSWADESGNGNNATQGVVAMQPTLQSAAFGRLAFPVLRFDTVDDGMTTPLSVNGLTPYSVFFLFRPATLNNVNSVVGSYIGFLLGILSGQFVGILGADPFYAPVNTTDFFLVEVRVTPGQLNGWACINGRATQLGGPPGYLGTVALGATCEDAYPASCDLAELIIYDRLLTDKDAVQLRRYFQATYNFLKV